MIKLIDSGADFSPDKTHRYALWRHWEHGKSRILFIGLNPSRADETLNDPTIRRCIDFAQRLPVREYSIAQKMGQKEGDNRFGGMYFANLYSFRTPDPKVLIENLPSAIGEDCNNQLRRMAQEAFVTVCCWGAWKFTGERVKEVLDIVGGWSDIMCFGLNQDGSPKHPLYLPKTATLQKFIL